MVIHVSRSQEAMNHWLFVQLAIINSMNDPEIINILYDETKDMWASQNTKQSRIFRHLHIVMQVATPYLLFEFDIFYFVSFWSI